MLTSYWDSHNITFLITKAHVKCTVHLLGYMVLASLPVCYPNLKNTKFNIWVLLKTVMQNYLEKVYIFI